jgi:trimethyllysine dioxygenase
MLEPIPGSPDAQVLLGTATDTGAELEASWQGKVARARFSYAWLRDHCHSKDSLNPNTLQRQVDTFSIPADIAPAKLEIADGGRTLRIVWKHDGTTSILPAAFLWDIAQNDGREAAPRRQLWDRASMGEKFPTMCHADIMSSDGGLLRWLSQVEEYGFALASEVPPTNEATKELVTRIGYVRQSIFGGMWDFTANMAFQDTAYTSAAIGPHTDGTYSIDPPGYQMFHCLKFDGSGGESTLVDGFKIADEIRRSDPIAFEVLSTVKVPGHYLGDGVHLRGEHPVIGLDHNGDVVQIAYNNYDRAPFRLPTPRMNAFYRALKLFHRMINDPANEITMRLAPGTALLFDNGRTLHGRRAYQGVRWLCGAYLNREDFDSKLRVLRTAMRRPPAAS